MPGAYPTHLLPQIALGVPFVAPIAALWPARRAIALPVTETVSHD